MQIKWNFIICAWFIAAPRIAGLYCDLQERSPDHKL